MYAVVSITYFQATQPLTHMHVCLLLKLLALHSHLQYSRTHLLISLPSVMQLSRPHLTHRLIVVYKCYHVEQVWPKDDSRAECIQMVQLAAAVQGLHSAREQLAVVLGPWRQPGAQVWHPQAHHLDHDRRRRRQLLQRSL